MNPDIPCSNNHVFSFCRLLGKSACGSNITVGNSCKWFSPPWHDPDVMNPSSFNLITSGAILGSNVSRNCNSCVITMRCTRSGRRVRITVKRSDCRPVNADVIQTVGGRRRGHCDSWMLDLRCRHARFALPTCSNIAADMLE